MHAEILNRAFMLNGDGGGIQESLYPLSVRYIYIYYLSLYI